MSSEIPSGLVNTELLRIADGDLSVLLGDPQPLIFIEAEVCRHDGTEAPNVMLGLDKIRALALVQMLNSALQEMQ